MGMITMTSMGFENPQANPDPVKPDLEANLEKAPSLEAFLEVVDLDTMREIYEEIAEKSGVDPESIGFVEEDKIYSDKSMVNTGIFNRRDQTIGLNAKQIEMLSTENVVYEAGRDRNLMYLATLCHEEAHAVSHLNVGKLEDIHGTLGLVQGVDIRSGFHEVNELEIGGKKLGLVGENNFRVLNEGVTEKLARQVFREYQSRNPIVDVEEEKRDPKIYEITYRFPVAMVEGLVERISSECDVGEDLVWNALVRGYMDGLNLREEELNEALSEIISGDAVERLSNMTDWMSTIPMNIELFVKNWSPEKKEKILRAIGLEIKKND